MVLQMNICTIVVRFYLTNVLQISYNILICKIFIFFWGGHDLGLEMEIGTIKNGKWKGLGLKSPWQTCRKQCQFHHICTA